MKNRPNSQESFRDAMDQSDNTQACAPQRNTTCRHGEADRSPDVVGDSAPKLASQIRTAFPSMAWNTGSSSPGEELMTRNTSAVAFSRSSATSPKLASEIRTAFPSMAWNTGSSSPGEEL